MGKWKKLENYKKKEVRELYKCHLNSNKEQYLLDKLDEMGKM